MRKIYLQIVLGVFGCAVSVLQCLPVYANGGNSAPSLIISEFQTTGLEASAELGTHEFVELYNPSDVATNAQVWRLEYLSASNDGSGSPTRLLGTIEAVVGAKSYLLFSYEGYLGGADGYFGAGSAAAGWIAKSGGHLRIVDMAGRTIDAVGWGSAVPLKAAPETGSWWHASAIPAGASIQRILAGEVGYTDGLAFASPGEPNPYGGNRPLLPGPEDPELPGPGDPADPTDPVPEERPRCEGLVLTEVLPNPAGADAGREFVEIYNSGDAPVLLRDCSLRLGAAGDSYVLPDEMLPPQTYRAIYDSESGITLPNTSPQTVWLLGGITPSNTLYPSAMKDDQVWMLLEGQWEVGEHATPGAPNVRSQTPLPAVSLTTVPPATAIECPPGKERNPATNRCRSIVTASSAPAPCKPGQQRNPETSRCRSVLNTVTSSKPCPEGQERNLATNRCRKKSTGGTTTIAQVQDVNSPSAANDVKWWVLGLVAAGAIGYALYEWRRDVSAGLLKLKSKYFAKTKKTKDV